MSALNLDDVFAYQRARSFDVFGWFKLANYNLSAPGQPQNTCRGSKSRPRW